MVTLDTDSETFETTLATLCERTIDERLVPMDDLAALFGRIEAGDYANAGPGLTGDSYDKFCRGPTLAALGRLDDAEAHLGALAQKVRAQADMSRHEAQKWLKKSPQSLTANAEIERADADLALVDALNRLLAHVRKKDRPGIADLLHEWQRSNVRAWGVEHLWEPTPFPVELGR